VIYVSIVLRSEFQTVGVAAFALACEHKDLSCYCVSDLSYLTDYSSSKENINNMKKEMYRKLMNNMDHPNPAHYLPRFSQAGNLECTNHTNDGYGKFSSIHPRRSGGVMFREATAQTQRPF